MKVVSVRMPVSQVEQLHALADTERRSFSQQIVALIDEALAAREHRRKTG